MDVSEACWAIREWMELFSSGAATRAFPPSPVLAVARLQRFLEVELGQPVPELQIAEELLKTKQGIRFVMPFVLKSEAILAAKRRQSMSR